MNDKDNWDNKDSKNSKQIKHPYLKYKSTDLWELIDKIINDLIENKDIEITTKKEYIIGYICKELNINE